MKLFETLQPKNAGDAAGIALHDYVSNRSVALLLRSQHGRLDMALEVRKRRARIGATNT